MAENTEKKVLLSVDIVDNFITAKDNVEKWNKALEDSQKSVDTTKKEIQNLNKELKNAEKEFKAAEKAVKNFASVQELLGAASEKAVSTLDDISAALTDLQNTKFEGLDDTQVKTFSTEVENLKDKVESYKGEVQSMAQDSQAWQTTGNSISFISEGLNLVDNTMKAFGFDTVSAFDILRERLGAVSSVMSGLTKINDLLTNSKVKQLSTNTSVLKSKGTLLATTKTLAAAENAEAAASTTSAAVKTKGIIATNAATIAQRALNAAMSAMPILAIIAAVKAGIDIFNKFFSSSAKAAKESEKSTKEYEQQAAETASKLTEINNKEKNEVDEMNNKIRERVLEMKKSGASEEEIAKEKARMEQELRDKQIGFSKERQQAIQEEADAKAKQIALEEEILKSFEGSSKKKKKQYEEQAQKIREAKEAHEALIQTIKDEEQAQNDLNLSMQEAAETTLKNSSNAAIKAAEDRKKVREAEIKAEAGYLSDDFATKQQYAKKLFDLNQETEREKLKELKASGQLTQKEYENQMSILNSQQREFRNKQAKESEDYAKKEQAQLIKQQEELLKLIKDDTEIRIDEVEEKYKKTIESLQKIEPPQLLKGQSQEEYDKAYKNYEDLVMRQAELEKKLETEKNQEIAKIRREALDKKIKDMQESLQQQHEDDLALSTGTELEKIKREKELQNKLIAEKEKFLNDEKALLDKQLEEGKISKEEHEISVAQIEKSIKQDLYEENAKLRALEFSELQQQANLELAEAEGNAQAQYEIKKQLLLDQLELYEEDAERRAEIMLELDELEQQYQEQKEERLDGWAEKTMEVMNGVDNVLREMEEAKLQRYEEETEREKELLQEKLDQGLISQEEYDEQVAELDAELDKKKAQIERNQAIRDKAKAVFEIGINTAKAIMAAVAAMPITGGLPFSAMAAASGAIQLAAVISKPLPKASKGMLIQGASHANGGVLIEAEGGEMIINRRSSQQYAPLLSAINEAGGGVPFVNPMSDGGYSARTIENAGITPAQIENAMLNAVSKTQIYVAMNELREADKNYTETIEQRSY